MDFFGDYFVFVHLLNAHKKSSFRAFFPSLKPIVLSLSLYASMQLWPEKIEVALCPTLSSSLDIIATYSKKGL